MKLLLTSTGITNETIKNKFIEMVGKKPEDMALAFIPTAINISSVPDKRWMIDNLKRLDAMKIGTIDIVDFSAVRKENWLPRLEASDVIFVEGGSPTYLLNEMKKAGLEKLFERFENKVYVGCSAGSNILGEFVIKTAKDDPGYKTEEGFGLVNFSIRPHFYRPDRPQFTEELVRGLAKKLNSTIYAIDDDTAIAVEDGQVEVISEGKWVKFS